MSLGEYLNHILDEAEYIARASNGLLKRIWIKSIEAIFDCEQPVIPRRNEKAGTG